MFYICVSLNFSSPEFRDRVCGLFIPTEETFKTIKV